MEEKIRTIERGRVPEIKNIGANVDDFSKSRIPTGRELSVSERVEYMRRKKIVKVIVSVKAFTEDLKTSDIYDEFNLHVVSDKHDDNVSVMKKHLDDSKELVDKLIKAWEGEI